jgi:nucleolar protein 53
VPLELVLPDELQDSLRRLKPEGNLLTDRFRHVLINGKLETRRRVGGEKRRKKVKVTEKWSYKDWEIPV